MIWWFLIIVGYNGIFDYLWPALCTTQVMLKNLVLKAKIFDHLKSFSWCLRICALIH